MKKSLLFMTEMQQLSSVDLMKIRGGRRLTGPGDTVADDIDMPDITNSPGPGDTVADDIDMPDITLNPIQRLRFSGKSMRNTLFF